MNEEKKSNNEKLSKVMPWVDQWFKELEKIPGLNKAETQIFKQIKNNWDSRDRIELLTSLENEYGDTVKTVIQKLLKFCMVKDWKEIADEKKDNSIESLINTLWTPLPDQGFEYTLEKKDGGFQILCTKCPFDKLKKEVNNREWIFELICMGDYYIVEGFNPAIEFKRDKTLVEGHEYCNHFYKMKQTTNTK